MISDLAWIFFSAMVVNNFTLMLFLGLCPFLGVSGRIDMALRMGAANTFVLVLTALAVWNLNTFVLAYARQLGLPLASLTPLFALTWARTLARFVDRLDGSAGPFARGSSEWLRQNRYYHAWRQSLACADELRWSESR